ncbi:hypothetical protein FB567DRAFT_611118 [Paraphoma chrysanthemicola]|uniref:Uncharacterized protein n=1 Tax=Paraphoma chrysanthemicola TaxID=798071 RepID=A0A8K0VT50_9PLEO|nr:hypothetical protein FB567DRAFT_611118 [Paraphoma chrysanthemicola]
MVAPSKFEGDRQPVLARFIEHDGPDVLNYGPADSNSACSPEATRMSPAPSAERSVPTQPLPINFIPCRRSDCSLASPYRPWDEMRNSERRKHLYRPLSRRDFEVGDIVNGPIVTMSMDNSQEGVATDFGRFSPKYRYGMVVRNCPTHMVILVFESAGGCGPMNKPPDKQRDCFGVTTEGTEYLCHTKDRNGVIDETVSYAPSQGVFYIPVNHQFHPKVGTYGDFSYVAALPYDSRVKDCGPLPDGTRDEILRRYLKQTLHETDLPLSMKKSMLEDIIRQLEQKEQEEAAMVQAEEAKKESRGLRFGTGSSAPQQNDSNRGQIARPQPGQPLAHRDSNALLHGQPKKRGHDSDVTMPAQETKRAKTDYSVLMSYEQQHFQESSHRGPYGGASTLNNSRRPSGEDSGYDSRPRGPQSARYTAWNHFQYRNFDSYRP